MSNEDYKWLEQALFEQKRIVSKQMENELKRIWYDVIEELVYYREPLVYHRTNQLKDKIKVEFKDDMIYAVVDTDNMRYYNSKGDVQGENVVHWVDVGHDTESPFEGNYDYFDHYPPRMIINEFAERVKNKYPEFKIEVYNETPPLI